LPLHDDRNEVPFHGRILCSAWCSSPRRKLKVKNTFNRKNEVLRLLNIQGRVNSSQTYTRRRCTIHISHIGLTNFRNYQRLELDLPANLIVFQGDNAQGKTNLLESMYMLATAKSHRAATDRELVSWASLHDELTATRVTAQIQTKSGDLKVEIVFAVTQANNEPQIQKKMKINGIPRRSIDIVGQMAAVLFTSHDIELIYGAPSKRRRYLDMANSQVDSKYLQALQRYSKVLLQRNHLLKLMCDHRADERQLEFWDSELVRHGSTIIEQRQQLIAELNRLAPPIHSQISSGEELKINYLPSVNADNFRKRLQEVRKREIAQRMSVVGPHRDDMSFLINGNDVNTYGSRGQQRTAALSLKLAEGGYLSSKLNDEPIILLDDVLSELDTTRRHQLLEAVSSYSQVVITTTDIDYFEPEFIKNAARFRIRDGTVVPIR
jgi:DNA replication and repair protein RecF